MKVEIELCEDSIIELILQHLRKDAEMVYSNLMELREKENLRNYQKKDLWADYKILGAMYEVEEYYTINPIIRNKFPRDD